MPAVFKSLMAAVLATTAPLRAGEVRVALGVNVHIEYTDGGYRDLAQVLTALRFVGIDKVRDAAPNPHNQGQAGYLALARAGVRFHLFVNGEEIVPAINRISELVRQAPGSVVAVEGPNEVNNLGGFTYAGLHDPHASATAYQAELYKVVRGASGLAGVPVATFTDYPVTPGRSDLGNFHSYPKGGGAPEPQLRSDASAAAQSTPGRPLLATEVGFATDAGPEGVSDLAQARLLLISLLDLASLDVRRSYIYQLLDGYADPGGQDQGRHWGLFDLDYKPKASARMLRRFTQLLSDASPSARTFPIRPAALAWTSMDSDVRKLVFEKADGEVLAAVWRETPVYDRAKGGDLEPAPEVVELRLGDAHGVVKVVDVVAGAEGVVDRGSETIRLALGANPLIVRIAPPAAQGAAQRSGGEPSPSKK